jgi:heavy metal translocating P-type ATPase
VTHTPFSWMEAPRHVARRRHALIAVLAILGIAIHLVLRFAVQASELHQQWPLWTVLLVGGVPLTVELLVKLFRREFGSDLLAGISIVTAVLLEEYLAGSLVVLMLSGGEALEAYAVRSASTVLEALARRMPSIAHRRQDGTLVDVDLSHVRVGDELVVFPHEVCPVDGTVVEGHGAMDESYLTGEPYVLSKTPGSYVLSGAINGEAALTIHADKLPVDSRYAKIVEVMRASEQQRPRLRRLGDQLGAYYTPLAVGLAIAAWLLSGDSIRFLAVLVVATPCPLLIAIPVAIIGAISLAAQRGIVIKSPAALETINQCRTAIFDKTGTLTYGRPQLTELATEPPFRPEEVLTLAASLERYSKHPLADAILDAAESRELSLQQADSISEEPGQGLRGKIAQRNVLITGRKGLAQLDPQRAAQLAQHATGLECVVVIDGQYAATLRFRDEPRIEGASFIAHLRPKHQFERVMLVSGDRESEVRHLADRVGIHEIHASQSPEQKLDIVRRETALAKTVFLGDGINDAPALTAATVGLAFGQSSDVITEAADAVIMDSRLQRVDELLHISRRMRRIALQSAVGGMLLSFGGMLVAAAGYLPPVAGAIAQEVIDVVVVLNALRMALPPGRLTDF